MALPSFTQQKRVLFLPDLMFALGGVDGGGSPPSRTATTHGNSS